MNKLPWFTHDHNARNDDFIQRAEDEFGAFGYAAWFKIIEVLHEHGTGDILRMKKQRLARELRSRWPQVELYLNFSRTSDKVEFNLSGDEVELQIKKFRERQSKMKSNLPSTFRQPSVNLPIHREREGEREVHIARTAPIAPKVRKTKHPAEHTSAVIKAYFAAKGWTETESAVDPGGWGRWRIEADRLLETLGGRVDLAQECIRDRAKEWIGVGDWTLAGVNKNAHEWLAKKQGEAFKR